MGATDYHLIATLVYCAANRAYCDCESCSTSTGRDASFTYDETERARQDSNL